MPKAWLSLPKTALPLSGMRRRCFCRRQRGCLTECPRPCCRCHHDVAGAGWPLDWLRSPTTAFTGYGVQDAELSSPNTAFAGAEAARLVTVADHEVARQGAGRGLVVVADHHVARTGAGSIVVVTNHDVARGESARRIAVADYEVARQGAARLSSSRKTRLRAQPSRQHRCGHQPPRCPNRCP